MADQSSSDPPWPIAGTLAGRPGIVIHCVYPGEVRERGTQDEPLVEASFYARLYALQFEGQCGQAEACWSDASRPPIPCKQESARERTPSEAPATRDSDQGSMASSTKASSRRRQERSWVTPWRVTDRIRYDQPAQAARRSVSEGCAG